MKIDSKVVKFGERKIIEVPKAARDNFSIGEKVTIEKKRKEDEKNGKKEKRRRI